MLETYGDMCCVTVLLQFGLFENNPTECCVTRLLLLYSLVCRYRLQSSKYELIKMARRTIHRQRVQEEYIEESDEDMSKRRKVEKNTTGIENYNFGFIVYVFLGIEDDEDYKRAVKELQRQLNNQLLLVQTELKMRIENANELASFEESRIEKFYNVCKNIHFYK